jgi:hypothetical protein
LNNKIKIKIESGDNKALIFVVKYINFYSQTIEIPSPEHPLMENVNIADIFELEINIFEEFIHITDPDVFDEKSKIINEIMDIAEELEMEILSDKMAAITSYYMINL